MNNSQINKFLKKAPNYKEVKALSKFFKKISKPPYYMKEDGLCAKLGGYEVKLVNCFDDGLLLKFNSLNSCYSGEYASIYAGLTHTGVWECGGNEQRHTLDFKIEKLSLISPSHKQIFELLEKFYKEVKDMELEKETTFDGMGPSH